jgi:GBP family porin
METVMRGKMLCAFGAMTICSVAHAQSSVTLYGIISDGIEYVSNAGGKRQVQMFSGAMNDDRFGFKVAEDLDGGLSAVATLENGFNVNSGALKQGGREFGRQAWVGLSDRRLGTITFGRQYDTNWDFLTQLVPASGGGGLGVDVGDNDNAFGSYRYNNSIKYVSPVMGGVRFEGLYALSNEAGNNQQNRAMSFGAGYNRGPLYLALTYTSLNQPGAVNTNGAVTDDYSAAPFQLFHSSPLSAKVGVDRQRTYGAGGSYTLGAFKLNVMVTDVSYRYLDQTSLHLDNGNATLNFQVNPAVLLSASYLYTRGRYSGVGANSGVHWNGGQLSADCALSVRTDVYVYSDMIKASGPRAIAVIFGSAPSSSNTQTILMAGIRHKF